MSPGPLEVLVVAGVLLVMVLVVVVEEGVVLAL